MKLIILTQASSYNRKQRAWRAFCKVSEQVRRAFFPDTGGISLYMHNWYRCAEKTNPEGAKLADWVEDSLWRRYRKLEAKIEANDIRREHQFGGHGKRFDPLWCPYCNPQCAASYGLELRGDTWFKIHPRF